MTDKIKLVQGDTRPQLVFSVTDETTGDPIDLSGASSIIMRFRPAGKPEIKALIPCFKLTGRVMDDGSVLNTPPYDTLGTGGRLFMDWTADALDTAGEFEGELEITFSDNTVQTVYDVIKFKVRGQF